MLVFLQTAQAAYACVQRSTAYVPVEHTKPGCRAAQAFDATRCLVHCYDQEKIVGALFLPVGASPPDAPWIHRAAPQDAGAAVMLRDEPGRSTGPPLSIRFCSLLI
ncbi:MAG: hypothetical protein HY323_17990 [Betaproteobacteria bacterium]|nr:hypothetical protein [Betaproteobacteria bacterium]